MLLPFAFCSALLLHPVHETYAELEWNADSRSCEVALRIHVLDEQWMRRSIDAEINSNWQADYLRKHVYFDRKIVKGDDGKEVATGKPIQWIGRKVEGAHAWWFFEVECKDSEPPKSVDNRLLFDREANYQHRVVVLGQKDDTGKSPSGVITLRHPSLKLSLGAPH
ncbi:DUF6702 family protein [Roseiconus lacunae]|uniref:DUF6702 family protein n=1 Tax=Roseiconus lacunae TaxID=2605694 RepID=UPI0011F2B968|nr:hypothetical protein [Roseiconus lacunae]